MLNQIVVVGSVIDFINVNVKEGRVKNKVRLEVKRAFNIENGVEEGVDYITFIVPDGIYENIKNHCTSGDTLGVKARISSPNLDEEVELVLEKCTFIQNKSAQTN
ncbi:hypothetical protein RJG79_10650 [Mycoplasmatota bacterium WC44]